MPEPPRYTKRTERELSRLGGVPKGSPSSAILQPTGSMIQSKATAVATRPPTRRNSPKTRVTTFAALIRLTRIRRENLAFNYGFYRPNPLALERQARKNARHGSDFTDPGSSEQAEVARSARKSFAYAAGHLGMHHVYVLHRLSLGPPISLRIRAAAEWIRRLEAGVGSALTLV
jgi:hypothetical protein